VTDGLLKRVCVKDRRDARVAEQADLPVAAFGGDREISLLGDASVSAIFDANALEQAISHLIQNAIDASSGEPVIVRVDDREDGIAVAITDRKSTRLNSSHQI